MTSPLRGMVVVTALALVTASAHADVDFRPFETERFQESVVDFAAERDRRVVLVVTQPDWCPPCIELDRRWLKNPEHDRVPELLADAVVAEVRGYDEDGARLLASQGVRFPGTPTLLVFDDVVAGRPLSEASLIGTIVGAPEDFPERLDALLSVRSDEAPDPLKAMLALRGTAAVDEDPVERAEQLLDLADRHVERGEAEEAREAIVSARRLLRGSDPRAEDLLERADWSAVVIAQRVVNDHEAALALIDRFESEHPGSETSTTYARAWSLARIGRAADALALAEREWLGEGDDGLSSFAYLAFRSEDPLLLDRAETALRAQLSAAPRSETGALAAVLARVLRRQGRLREAEALFARSVELAGSDAARQTAEAQLAHVRREIEAGYQPPERKPLSLQFVGYEPGGPFGSGFTGVLFVLPVSIVGLAALLVMIGVGGAPAVSVRVESDESATGSAAG